MKGDEMIRFEKGDVIAPKNDPVAESAYEVVEVRRAAIAVKPHLGQGAVSAMPIEEARRRYRKLNEQERLGGGWSVDLGWRNMLLWTRLEHERFGGGR